jgi:CheY-like chemotaxis protein
MTEKLTVLVAEDDEYTALPIRLHLGRYVRVVVVEEPRGLVERAAEADALVVDARLVREPGREEGLATVAKLLDEGVVAPEVPVIFISVLPEQAPLFQRSLSLPALRGRYVWLQKPFETEFLLSTILSEREKRTAP